MTSFLFGINVRIMLRRLLSSILGKKKSKKPVPKKKVKAPAKKKLPPKKKPAKKASASLKKKTKSTPNYGKVLGEVVAFFRIPVVAVIKIKAPGLNTGDSIWIKGHTTDIKMTIASMQIDHQPVPKAKKGDEVGVKVPKRVRRGDKVYQLPT